jgi:peptidoglycan/LPS O-acetylase OafA/YrhL
VNSHPTARSTVTGPAQGLLLLAVMFAGTVVYRMQHDGLGRRPAAAALAAVAAASVLVSPGPARWAATGSAVAITFAGAFLARNRPVPRLLAFLGTISYSLYLSHVLVLQAVGRLVPGLAYRPVPVRLVAGLAVLASALALAWAAYRWIEVPGQRIGRLLATERAAARTARGVNVGASV